MLAPQHLAEAREGLSCLASHGQAPGAWLPFRKTVCFVQSVLRQRLAAPKDKTRQDKTDTCDVLCFADLKLVTCFGRFALCRMAPGPSKSGDIRRAEGFRYHVRCGGGRVNEPVSLCFPRKPCLQGSRGMFSCCHVHATSAMAQALLVSPSSLASLTAWSLRNKWIL